MRANLTRPNPSTMFEPVEALAPQTRVSRWARRALTIPGFLLATAVVLPLLPALLLLAALYDATLGAQWVALRTVLALAWYLSCESLGLLAAALLWPLGALAPELARRLTFRLQCLWASALLGAGRILFGLEFQIVGDAAAAHGPLLLLMRHVSVLDTLLAAALISSQHGLRLRYVIKRELLWDPCLDVVGHRLPNAFVRRGTGGAAAEIEAVRRLGVGLGPRDGVLIFPEGTRFTPTRREKVLARLAERADPALHARASSLENLLPPRLGGVQALLEAAPEADVVIGGHTGFDGVRTLNDFWRGALVGRRIRVEFWRIPAAEIPRDAEERNRWLFDRWAELDRWVGARSPASVPVAQRG